MYNVNPLRVRELNEKPVRRGSVIYWIWRDQRVYDNWALLYASDIAQSIGSSVEVFFVLPPKYNVPFRQFDFMIKGAAELEQQLSLLNIPFTFTVGNPVDSLLKRCYELNAGAVVTDFDPLEYKQKLNRLAADKLDCWFGEVDAHNIVPAFIASDKEEFAAYTIRPKIKRLLNEFLTPFPLLKPQKGERIVTKQVMENMDGLFAGVNKEVAPVDWLKPGEKEGERELKRFISERLSNYSEKRNDPNMDAQSDLSPYLHFGHLSAQRVANEVNKADAEAANKESFLEELIVRKELSDNFCLYNREYDSFEGFRSWGRETLNKHRNDKRLFVYSLQEFEEGLTDDPLWNAAENELIRRGKMHGFMRMYWAKKILEWSSSPEEAMEIAVYLNDKYSIDGNDPNGYTGIAWSIGGVHDRAWGEREIFGKIRYMNYNGCKRKFDVAAYIRKWS
jgi:deoxyribodipyrimidine photo-lyase